MKPELKALKYFCSLPDTRGVDVIRVPKEERPRIVDSCIEPNFQYHEFTPTDMLKYAGPLLLQIIAYAERWHYFFEDAKSFEALMVRAETMLEYMHRAADIGNTLQSGNGFDTFINALNPEQVRRLNDAIRHRNDRVPRSPSIDTIQG